MYSIKQIKAISSYELYVQKKKNEVVIARNYTEILLQSMSLIILRE